jgi:hypothetical protein
MNDARTLSDVASACERGDLGAILGLLKRIAALSDVALAEANRLIRARFDASQCPRRLWSGAVRDARAEFFRSERAKALSAKAANNPDSKLLRRKDSLMAQFGKRGGMTKCPKGFATMNSETAAAVRAAALAGRQRAKAQRDAARRTLEATVLNQD